MTVSRYFHTVRHLKVGQVVNRLVRRIRRVNTPDDPTSEIVPLQGVFVEPIPPVGCDLQGDQFTFLNDARKLQDTGWDAPGISKLWRYNLHYMDYLGLLGPTERIDWARRWQNENPPVNGTGWEPYPVSLRVVNWCKWILLDSRANLSSNHEEVVQSLDVQASVLEQRVEWHLLGNHLFANAKALMFAALVLDSPRSSRRLKLAKEILSIELDEQFLEGGLHFEFSPMYHAILTHDVLDLLNLMQAYGHAGNDLFDQLYRTAQKGLDVLRGLSHPDGGPAFMNDSAVGIAPGLESIMAYAARIGIQLGEKDDVYQSLRSESFDGYVRLESPTAVAIVDCAPVGPDYIPGHAHADTLSFELSVRGERIVVNSGTSTYEKGDERAKQRGTKAHSTVTINDADSSEVWGGFRVARRARPMGFSLDKREGAIVVTCAHDGYRWHPGRPRHQREWVWLGNGLTISDRVDGRYRKAVARYHIGPTVTLVEEHPDGCVCRTESGQSIRFTVSGGHLSHTSSTYHPEFGLKVSNRCLEVALIDRKAQVHITWGE